MINSANSLIPWLLLFFGLLLKDRGNFANPDYVTQKIYGFLDFTTTVGNTVMIFSPHSTSNPIPTSTKSVHDSIKPSKTFETKKTDSLKTTENSFISNNIEINTIKSSSEPNITTSVKRTNHVTGLITRMSGTMVTNGLTTVHETSIIGTYISGKYAQILQSSSTVYQQNKPQNTQSLPVEPLFSTSEILIKPTKRSSSIYFATTEILSPKRTKLAKSEDLSENLYAKKRPKFSSSSRLLKKSSNADLSTVTIASSTLTTKKFQQRRTGKLKLAQFESLTSTTRKSGFKPKSATIPLTSTTSGSSVNFLPKFKLSRESGRWHYKTSPKPRVNIRRQLPQTFAELLTSSSSSVTSAAISTTNSDDISNDLEASQAKAFDTNSLIDNDDDNNNNNNNNNDNRYEDVIDKIDSDTDEASDVNDNDEDNAVEPIATKSEKKFSVETLSVNISIPSDNTNDIYYEIATIKTPYVFQVGAVKNTRYITVTSTFQKRFHEVEPTSATYDPISLQPLTENIFGENNREFDSGENQTNVHSLISDSELVTLKPLYATKIDPDNGIPTPPLETITETLTTTQNVIKTHILPIIYQTDSNLLNLTSSLTLLQTYHITRVISATKTIAVMEINQLNDNSQHLDEAGSEHLPQVDFGDENDAEKQRLSSTLDDLKEIDADFDLGAIDEKRVRLLVTKRRLKSLKPAVINNNLDVSRNNFVTISKPILKIETVYDTKVLPIIYQNGQQTSFTTISKSIGTFSRTEYEYMTLAPQNNLGLSVPQLFQSPPQQAQQPYFPPQPLFQPQFTLTSTPIVSQTLHTKTDSKILKLTFGARTTMTTIYSTKVVPTLVTTYLTTSIPLQNPGHLFPGYYPPPFAGYPFLG